MPRILFVDDDPVTLELMGQAARLLGHQAILARTGADGFVKAEEQNPGSDIFGFDDARYGWSSGPRSAP